MEKNIISVLNVINESSFNITNNNQTLTFQAEVLSGDELMITTSTDPTYFDNFCEKIK